MVADELALGAGEVDEPGAARGRARAVDGDQRIAARELEQGGEVVLGPPGDRPRRAAPDARYLAAGQEAHEIEAVYAFVQQDATAREFRLVEPAQRRGLEALVEVDGAQRPEGRQRRPQGLDDAVPAQR